MEIGIKKASLTEIEADIVVVNLFEGVKIPGGATGAVDKALEGLISDYVIKQEEFEGKFGQFYVLPTYGKIPAKKVLIAGLGKREDFNFNKIRELSAKIVKQCASLKATTVVSILHGAGIAGFDPYECAKAIAEGTLIGNYKFLKYKTKKEGEEKQIECFNIVEIDENNLTKATEGLAKGKIIAKATNYARDLVNEPASMMTPETLALHAKNIKGVDTRIFEEEDIQKFGMGAFWAVSKGSNEAPKFIHIKYKHPKATKKTAIIGKGLTFDSGGLDLKPASSMLNMKDDMSGAAAMIGIMTAIAELKPEIEVHALIAATENMPGDKAFKPGDVLKAMNGKTIEVDNTDAEGRLTLADALCYAVDLDVDEIIDVATLTGACLVALGYAAAGIMGTNKDLVNKLIDSAEKSGEKLWELPMFEEYKDSLKSDIADMKNTGSRYGGASTAAIFLKEFAGDKPWAHIDIAGPAFIEKDMRELSKGATGASVRTLLKYLVG